MKRYYVAMWGKDLKKFRRYSTNSLKLALSPFLHGFAYIVKVTDREAYDVIFYKKGH